MTDYHFERVARTPQSESWRVETDAAAIGRVDLHFTDAKAYGTLVVHSSLPEAEIEALISEIDARLVSTADEYREDFVVTVWRGEEFGTFSEDDDDAFEDDEAAASGT
ncbi:MAG: hypothetical protein EXR64_04305 [Dehalococcoidia bacterium]|nr:hypothetical protein [Dehalococcoidia bacterium]